MNKQNKDNALPAVPSGMVKEIFQDMSLDQRLEALRNSADQIVKHSYNKPYTDAQVAEIRKKISDLCIQLSDLDRELAAEKAHYKAIMTPLENDREKCIGDLRAGGEHVTEECFVYIFYNEGKAGLYTKDGILLNEMDITQDMEQATIFQALRDAPDDQSQEDGDILLLEDTPEDK